MHTLPLSSSDKHTNGKTTTTAINNGYITGMIKVTNSKTPNISHKYLQNMGKHFQRHL